MSQLQSIPSPARPRRRWRWWLAGLVTVLAAAILIFGTFVRAPYVLYGPGPTLNVLGQDAGRDIINVSGADVFPTSGELRMTTVSQQGGPGTHLTYFQVASALLSDDWDVEREEDVFPQGTTREQISERGAAQMVSSQENAEARALTELGYQVPVTMKVVGTTNTSDAAGKLQEGDILRTIKVGDQQPAKLDTYAAIHDFLAQVEPGSVVTLEFERDGKTQTADIKTQEPINSYTGGKLLGVTGSRLGVFLTVDMDLPLDVGILVENITGPSAGMIFGLALIDKLTEGDLTGGNNIAGTGTLGMDGTVGPIGGAPQKLLGAKRDGAEYFLLPVDNCADISGRVPDGLHVYAVATLGEARQTVEGIAAGDFSRAQTCEQAIERLAVLTGDVGQS
ncbi:YlbL family protein [Buchananella hordeovulneris]|uniref:YlbL family protein n=1 Tax=Buchananella hordeovulneris TaxID=52770 RepID=UPI00130101BA|nr:S16 family serine protease [Buchananella hordeovulneris]